MKRICLVVVGLYMNLLGAFAQVKDTSAYKPRKLKLEEINFVSSYYSQDGNNSAVTGGIGTEALKDYSNNFEVKLVKYNKRQRKVDIGINLGIDYYTSASSDKINPYSISSASAHDLRIYPTLSHTVTNEQKGSSHTESISYSDESDYRSYGFGAGLTKKSVDGNAEFGARFQVYLDWLKLILPIEFRNNATGGLEGAPNQYIYPWAHRNTFSTSFTFSKVVNPRLQFMLLMDLTYQEGFLGLPFHRVFFSDHNVKTEVLPSSRFKVPFGIKANYFSGDKVILRGYYRFYEDDWGLNAHTADLETTVKCSPFFSVTPFYRYYHQTAVDYFAPYGMHDPGENFYSSNYDLSAFSSHFLGAGIRTAPSKGLLGKKHWKSLELRYGYYKRSNGLHASIISLNLNYK